MLKHPLHAYLMLAIPPLATELSEADQEVLSSVPKLDNPLKAMVLAVYQYVKDHPEFDDLLDEVLEGEGGADITFTFQVGYGKDTSEGIDASGTSIFNDLVRGFTEIDEEEDGLIATIESIKE